MNKQPYWIGYYLGQSCIIHPETGRWALDGYCDGMVSVKRKIDGINHIKMYDIEDIQFILKQINPFLFASMSNFHWFIKNKAAEGYWMFPGEFERVIFET